MLRCVHEISLIICIQVSSIDMRHSLIKNRGRKKRGRGYVFLFLAASSGEFFLCVSSELLFLGKKGISYAVFCLIKIIPVVYALQRASEFLPCNFVSMAY